MVKNDSDSNGDGDESQGDGVVTDGDSNDTVVYGAVAGAGIAGP